MCQGDRQGAVIPGNRTHVGLHSRYHSACCGTTRERSMEILFPHVASATPSAIRLLPRIGAITRFPGVELTTVRRQRVDANRSALHDVRLRRGAIADRDVKGAALLLEDGIHHSGWQREAPGGPRVAGYGSLHLKGLERSAVGEHHGWIGQAEADPRDEQIAGMDRAAGQPLVPPARGCCLCRIGRWQRGGRLRGSGCRRENRRRRVGRAKGGLCRTWATAAYQ